MNTQTQKTETTFISARTKSLAAMPKDKKALNLTAIKAMKNLLLATALTATFHLTKGLRIGSGFAGKFVVNLCNAIAKNGKDEGLVINAVEVLNDFRNSANYKGDVPSKTIAKHFTIGRVNAYARILGKKYGCTLRDADVYACVQLVSEKLFHAITK